MTTFVESRVADGGAGGVVQSPPHGRVQGAAGSKQNEYFNLKNLIFCAQLFLNYWKRGISINNCDYFLSS